MPLLVVTGPPGAGKSTVARLLAGPPARAAWSEPSPESARPPDADAVPSAVVEGDAFFGFLARGALAPWLPGSHAQNEIVTRAAAATAGRFAAEGYDTVYDGVVGPWFLPTFVEASGLEWVDYAVLLPPVEVCVDRVRSRSGHGFTDVAATRKMHDEFATSVDGHHVIVDGDAAPADVAERIIAARATGGLVARG